MEHALLSRHHAELDQRIGVLLTTAGGGDCHDLANAWGPFERELLHHFELEEQHLFRRYALEQPEEVSALKQEHEALRRDLLALGIRADLHGLRAEAVKEFVAELRGHAAREEKALYRWANAHVESDTWSIVGQSLRDARETVTNRLGEDVSTLGSTSS